MTLFDYYLCYMTEVWEGTRPAPEGITLPEGGDENARMQALGQQLQDMGMAAFVRACAAQDGTELSEELFTESGDLGGFELFLQNADKAQEAPAAEKKSATPDPDANKHAFEVFLDCIAMDDGLVQYLIDVLKRMEPQGVFQAQPDHYQAGPGPGGVPLLAGPSGNVRRRGGAGLCRRYGPRPAAACG